MLLLFVIYCSDLFLGTRQTIRQGWTRGYASASGIPSCAD